MSNCDILTFIALFYFISIRFIYYIYYISSKYLIYCTFSVTDEKCLSVTAKSL